MKVIKLIVKDTVEKSKPNQFEKFINKIFGDSEESKKINQVDYWYLEIQEETGKVYREIGFNESKEPVVLFPSNENPHGFWADSPVTINLSEFELIPNSDFEAVWKDLN